MKHLPGEDLIYILKGTYALWSEFKNARFFITGGTGFIGTWLVETLVEANKEYQLNLSITLLTRNYAAYQNKAPHLCSLREVQYVEGDVRTFIYPEQTFTHVIHGAADACAVLNRNQPLLMLNTITNGTQRMLAFAHFINAKKFLFLSSGAIYGKQPVDNLAFSECHLGSADNLNTHAAYAIGKLTAEHICALYAEQYALDIKIARLFSFVGPHLPLNKHYAIGNFIRDALAGHSIQVKSDGSAYRSYLYAADLIIALLHILCVGKTMQPYNVGGDQAISIQALANMIAKQFTPALDVVIGGALSRSTSERYIPDISRIRHEFGLHSFVALSVAIHKTIKWYRDNAKGQ